MASNSELNSLRAKVRQEHRRATAKASRLRAKGVEVSGTSFDPRRDLSNVKRYTRKQLESYSAKLNRFNSRDNTLYAGAGGSILPGAEVRRLRQAESRLRRKATYHYNKIADISLPGRGMSIREADLKDRPNDRVRAGGQAVRRPLDFQRRKLSNITGVEGLRALTSDTEKRAAKGFTKSAIGDQRRQLMDMLTTIGNIEDVKKASELTDYQFNILFNYNTDKLNEISMEYEYIKLRAAGTEEEFQTRIHEKSGERISNAIDWASTLTPPTRKKKK